MIYVTYVDGTTESFRALRARIEDNILNMWIADAGMGTSTNIPLIQIRKWSQDEELTPLKKYVQGRHSKSKVHVFARTEGGVTVAACGSEIYTIPLNVDGPATCGHCKGYE